MRRRVFIAGIFACAAAPARADGGERGEALAGDRFRIGEEEFHLADIIAPSAFAFGEERQAYFSAARRALQAVLNEGEIIIERAIDKTRWGADIVDAHRAGDDLTLQDRIVEAGAARVAPQTDNLALIDRLLEAERRARAALRGLWRERAYRVFDAAAAERAAGRYHLVEGEVLQASLVRERFYLNFGEDYRTDFTASATRAVYRRWLKERFDLAALAGARVRIRGFVRDINGPSIELAHPRQVEILKRA